MKFDSVAVWARALTNKAGIETGNEGHVAKIQTYSKALSIFCFGAEAGIVKLLLRPCICGYSDFGPG